MKEVYEIRIHGRGGQGAKTAATLLADAALEGGKYIQSFPEYGPERAGAPMKAFTRIADRPIRVHCGVLEPEVVAVIDPTLLDAVDVTEGVDDKGILIVNTSDKAADVKKKLKFKGKVFTVDATKIALDTLGRNLPNTPILGAILKATAVVELEALKENIRNKFLKKIGEELTNKNLEAVERAFEEVDEA